mgnify:CR=1 FL=1
MPDDMGTLRVDVEIENPARPGERRTLRSVLVDTGAELSWVPAEALEDDRAAELLDTLRFVKPVGIGDTIAAAMPAASASGERSDSRRYASSTRVKSTSMR